MEFMPHNAPLVVLTFLGSGLLLALGALVFMFAVATRRFTLAGRVLVSNAVLLGLYAGVLLAASLRSEEKLLTPGELKYFCEIDCHLAYSVAAVETVKDAGAATGSTTVVRVKMWFDERTTRATRGDFPLAPNQRAFILEDDRGARHFPSLPASPDQPLRPGESAEFALAFDLPADARPVRLLITDAGWAGRFLIGHENSFLHKKIFFRLPPAQTGTSPSRS